MSKTNYRIIGDSFFATLQGFKEFESTPRDYGTGDLLYGSEIHTLQMIGRQVECNQNDLCRLLEISKSGISKFVNKLVDKELVNKKRNEENRKEVVLTLTEKGRIAYLAHEEFDKKIFAAFYNILDDCSHSEILFIEDFLLKLRGRIQDLNSNK
ncbi:MAG: MarR family winged helix-turn-helix transcriptional regulator [Spirochaetales bacterium]|nr:MarR family winged helix-turn-helix transcriptional regulator [Spirochaetales bacterium]